MATTRPPSRRSSSSSNRWSAQFSDVPSPPPSYNSGASRAPSFRSSIHSTDNDSILPVSQPPTVLKKPKPSGDKWPLKPILEDEKPNVPPPPYTPPKRRRRPLFIWLCCFLAVMILAVSIVPPILVIITKSHHGADAGNSTTSTITSVVRTTLIFDSTTIISSTAIVVVTSTSNIPPGIIVATTSSSIPTPTSTPFYLGGFDAIHAESGGTTNQFLFYTDQLGNIKQINGSGYASDGYGYSQGYDSNWSPGSPAVIASNALPGSPVQAVLLDSGEVQVFYVNNQSVVQNVVGTLSTVYSEALWTDFSSYSWTAGSIASLGLITSKDPCMRICIPDQFTYGDPTPTLYLYYRTSAGEIGKYSWSNVTTPAWQEVPGNELPNIPVYANLDCQFDSGIESIWSFDSEGRPQQWWRSYVNKTGWTLGASGENTAEFAALNSSILSITAGSSNAFGRSHIFFQDTNNQLVRYDINGRGANSTLANVTYDGTVTPGTRLATWANGDDCEQDVDVYFQRDNTSQLHYLVFKDLGYYTNGYDLSDGEYYIVTTSVDESVVDPVVTWGNPPPKGSVHIHLKHWTITVIVVFAIIALLGLCCCCSGCS